MIKLPESQNENPVFEILIIGVVLIGGLVWLILNSVRMVFALFSTTDKTGEN